MAVMIGTSQLARAGTCAVALTLLIFILVYHLPPMSLSGLVTVRPSALHGHGHESVITTSEASSERPGNVACPSFPARQAGRPEPWSKGRRKFPLARPPPHCRTFQLPAMEALLERMKERMVDADLFRLFENSYPNTLDSMVRWRGHRKVKDAKSGEMVATDEELTYLITGYMDAMWLRDSAGQMYSYLPLLEASSDPDSLASLWRGLINAQARYIVISPYCNSFQAPVESGISPTANDQYQTGQHKPPYNPDLVFACKWGLDSLASFLQISAAYYERTGDGAFFSKYGWMEAVRTLVDAAALMRRGTYDQDGRVLPSAWTFTGWSTSGSETLTNNGLGNPVRENGMVRSGFRPSDDACIFQLLTPSNMMLAAYLERSSVIMHHLATHKVTGAKNLTVAMRELAGTIRTGIARHAIVRHAKFGDIFAYEVDGYGSVNPMDDATMPSLLAIPLWNYTRPNKGTSAPTDRKDRTDPDEHDYARVYQNTRAFALSSSNPYFAKGPVLSAVGGLRDGPGKAWPMAAIITGLTAYDDLAGLEEKERDEVVAHQLRMLLDSTRGTGLIHESVDAWDEGKWTRSWFGWANGLFGELIMKIAEDEESRGLGKGQGLLGRSWQ